MSDRDKLESVHGKPIRAEVIPCTTDQWNFPFPRNQPWAEDGECSVCGQTVEMVPVGKPQAWAYWNISAPHTRVLRWFAIDEDELLAFIQYMEEY